MTAAVVSSEACLPPTNGRALLISIRPPFVKAILNGTKTVELRRTRPNLPAGSTVLLYSTSPVKAIVGWACLADVVEGDPEAVLEAHKGAAAISDTDFENYFDGSPTAIALRFCHVEAAVTPLALDDLRLLGIQPPQSWRYLEADIAGQIRHR